MLEASNSQEKEDDQDMKQYCKQKQEEDQLSQILKGSMKSRIWISLSNLKLSNQKESARQEVDLAITHDHSLHQGIRI